MRLRSRQVFVLSAAFAVCILMSITIFALSTGGSGSSAVSQPWQQPGVITTVVPQSTEGPLTPYPTMPGMLVSPTPYSPVNLPSMTAVPTNSDPDFDQIPTYEPNTTPGVDDPNAPYHLIANAAYWPPSVTEANEQASFIISGTVRQVEAARWTTSNGQRPTNPFATENKDYIFTPVIVEVEKTLKGKEYQRDIALLAYGGRVGSDVVEWRTNQLYSFQKGDRVILFLTNTQPVDRVQMNGGQALWRIVDHYTVTDKGLTTNGYLTLGQNQLIKQIQSLQR